MSFHVHDAEGLDGVWNLFSSYVQPERHLVSPSLMLIVDIAEHRTANASNQQQNAHKVQVGSVH